MHALITGASSGIGEAIAREFAAKGWNVSLVARRKENLDELAAELKVKTFVRPADLSDPDVCAAVVDDCVTALGPIDVLVNNAGIQFVEPTAGVSVERMQRLIAVNLTSPLTLIQLVMPDMIARKSGAIVNIASVAAITHTPGMCHYNGSKAGLDACSESLRVELAADGVHVLTVYPGPVRSAMEEAAREKYEESWAMKQMPTGDPATLARKIFSGTSNKTARIIYPSSYGLTRFTRVSSQWVTDVFTPSLRKT